MGRKNANQSKGGGGGGAGGGKKTLGKQASQEGSENSEVTGQQQQQRPKEIRNQSNRARRCNGGGPRGESSNDSLLKSKFTFSAVVVGLVSFVAYYGYLGYLETRIYTPLAEPKVVKSTGLAVPDRFWGSYRSGVYFGMKHRSPKSLLTGMMWMLPSQMRRRNPGLRHLCQQDDNLQSYGWIEHDGSNFGVQEIFDNDMKITTSFVKRAGGVNGGDWTARINVEPLTEFKDPKDISDEIVLSFYVATEPGLAGTLNPQIEGDSLIAINGNTSDLDLFNIRFINSVGVLQSSHLITKVRSMNDISHATLSNTDPKRMNGKWIYVLSNRNNPKELSDPNLYIHQVHAKGPFTMEVVFESGSFMSRTDQLSEDVYTTALENHRKKFREKFEDTFHLQAKGFNDTAILFAQAAFSNLIGGIGYFHGNSKVQSVYNPTPVPYWPASLYSTVPSRSFFPRGFLWDEGFHLLLLNKWNPQISLDIIAHWLDLMNTEGWIPREQILGEEALSRVPEEFVVQRNDVANPPTLLLGFYDLLLRHHDWLLEHHKPTLFRMWPRLVTWFRWLNTTQIGELPGTYRWRGRNATTVRELNPKTLASGLDDYPRASHPTDSERHLDLRCWMAVAAKLMADLADVLGYERSKYEATWRTLVDSDLLNSLHWSKELNAYADWGMHSPKTILKRVAKPDDFAHHHHVEKERVVLLSPKSGFVNVFGYVSLFPMLLQILSPDSENLVATVKQLKDPNLLWTPFGLRSLAANAPFYNARNTEHDPPYWRGPVWININFLALKSLKYYSERNGKAASLCKERYTALRENVIENIMHQYYRTGYIWEQYNDANGDGKGCRPFTGWSSLVVLIMAEEY